MKNTDKLFYDNATVEITKDRWKVSIIITGDDFSHEFIVSSDEALTGSDGIWLGTFEEYEDWE